MAPACVPNNNPDPRLVSPNLSHIRREASLDMGEQHGFANTLRGGGGGGSLRPLRHPADLKTRKHDWCLPKETGHCRRELFRMREHISHSLVSAARQGKSPCEHRKCHFPPIGRGREIGHFLLGTFLSLGPRRLISRVRLHARPLHAMCFSAHARTLVHVRGRCGVVITWNWRQTNGHYQFHAHLFPFVFLCAFVDWRGKLETASFV